MIQGSAQGRPKMANDDFPLQSEQPLDILPTRFG
jgi:hypothetical protein